MKEETEVIEAEAEAGVEFFHPTPVSTVKVETDTVAYEQSEINRRESAKGLFKGIFRKIHFPECLSTPEGRKKMFEVTKASFPDCKRWIERSAVMKRDYYSVEYVNQLYRTLQHLQQINLLKLKALKNKHPDY